MERMDRTNRITGYIHRDGEQVAVARITPRESTDGEPYSVTCLCGGWADEDANLGRAKTALETHRELLHGGGVVWWV